MSGTPAPSPQAPPQVEVLVPGIMVRVGGGVNVTLGVPASRDGRTALASNLDGAELAGKVWESRNNRPTPIGDPLVEIRAKTDGVGR
ncbi:hypothetical protein SCMU_18380 [Sinomonas cyclohexanicum]|uniref:Uncharacterized protein n=1 Tax=Sinomonas cyclohexanicum TaxID=322009 RepID=A0ABM7PUS3_SINCY|nr:hypothetical protein [Corynebacterium cyclohexanicum]BCT75996.1 hypothetical protein SCMU_18380 [Corynebacterium cyclohexanicum]